MEIRGISQGMAQYNVRINLEEKDGVSKEQENASGTSSSGTTQTQKTSGTPASSGAGEASTENSGTCSNCGATLASGASVCGKCGTVVESASDKLLRELTESGEMANSTDHGISVLSVLSVQAALSDQEEEKL